MPRSRRAIVVAGLGLLATVGLAGALLAQDATRRRGFSVEISEPLNQAIVFGKTRIAATVKIADPDLVDRVEFLVGDEVIFVDREAPYECLYDFGEKPQSRILRAVAYHVEEVFVSDAVITRRLAFTVVERVNRVVLWVSASDKDGNFLTDLEQEDFEVFEGDRQQEILEFYREDRPITLAILLDSSGSMQDKLKEVRAAASAFVDTLRAEDKALVIDFDDSVFLIQDLTADHEDLKKAIVSVEAIGATALYDVIHAAYRKIGTIEGRKAMILLSDGEDTASQAGFNRVLEEAKSNNTMIFAIGLGGWGSGPRKGVLRDFSDYTGGRPFFVNKAADLAEVYEKIAEELRTQYYLAYSTSNEDWDGRWIDLRVENTRPGVKVRSRRGYFAARSPTDNDG